MPAILHRVRRFIRQHDLMRPETRVISALSGGSDSVALARILAALHARGELQFVGIVHVNHALRPTADRDEQFCRNVAAQLDRPILVERVDVGARATHRRQSVESAAHDLRYAAYARARAHFAADAVAVGHTRDDQAETFLLRLLRGAGPKGLAGMHPRRGDVVRPLLDCPRAALRAWLLDQHAEFVEDETNADRTIPRNAVRAELVPHLADFNPNIVEVLAREADVSREIWAWLADELERFGDGLDVERVRQAPRPLQRLALWRALGAQSRKPIGAAHVDAALRLLDAADGASIDAPGVRVHRIASRIVLTNRTRNPANHENPENVENRPNLWRFPLSIPGEVTAQAMRLSAELAVADAEIAPSAIVGNGTVAAIRADGLQTAAASPLAVRNRRPGDRFRPVGLAGRKKLQDLFVDRKIARGERDSIPIVVDDCDRIVWVAGHGIDEAFRVTEASEKVVVLRLRYLERCS